MLMKKMVLPFMCLITMTMAFGCGVNREGLTRFQGLPTRASQLAPIHVAIQPGELFYLDVPGSRSLIGVDAAYFEEVSREGGQVTLKALKEGETRVQVGDQVYIVSIFDLAKTPTAYFIAETVNMDAKYRGHPYFLRAVIVPTDSNRYRKQVYGDAKYKDDWIINDSNGLMFVTNIPQPAPFGVRVLLLMSQSENPKEPRPVYQEVRVAAPGSKVELKRGQYLIIDVGAQDNTGVKVEIQGDAVSKALETEAGLLIFRGEKPGKSKVDIQVLKNTRNVRLSPLEVQTISDKVHAR